MSLMTAFLAFLPALAAKKTEPEPELDPQIELLQAREGRERAEALLADTRREVSALAIEVGALRDMLREGDRFIADLTANLPLPAVTYVDPPVPAVAYERQAVDPRRMAAYPNQGMQCVNAQALHQQSQQLAAQADFMAALTPRDIQEIQWRSCTCVPGRANALLGGGIGRI